MKQRIRPGWERSLLWKSMPGAAAACWTKDGGAANASPANGLVWPMLPLNTIGAFPKNSGSRAFAMGQRTASCIKWDLPDRCPI